MLWGSIPAHPWSWLPGVGCLVARPLSFLVALPPSLLASWCGTFIVLGINLCSKLPRVAPRWCSGSEPPHYLEFGFRGLGDIYLQRASAFWIVTMMAALSGGHGCTQPGRRGVAGCTLTAQQAGDVVRHAVPKHGRLAGPRGAHPLPWLFQRTVVVVGGM